VPVWVKLKAIKTIEVAGETKRLHPGDWVSVGRGLAERWVLAGEAWRPNDDLTAPPGAGVLVRGQPNPGCRVLETLPHTQGGDHLPYPKTLVWDPALGCRAELLGVGFRLLEKWLVAAPLYSYDQLACHVGDEDDRERTRAVVRDLRVPLYDPRMVFVRRCAETVKLMAIWNEERRRGRDERLALLRAIYQAKPVICALPVSWTGAGR
jgi:hypothetical protein